MCGERNPLLSSESRHRWQGCGGPQRGPAAGPEGGYGGPPLRRQRPRWVGSTARVCLRSGRCSQRPRGRLLQARAATVGAFEGGRAQRPSPTMTEGAGGRLYRAGGIPYDARGHGGLALSRGYAFVAADARIGRGAGSCEQEPLRWGPSKGEGAEALPYSVIGGGWGFAVRFGRPTGGREARPEGGASGAPSKGLPPGLLGTKTQRCSPEGPRRR